MRELENEKTRKQENVKIWWKNYLTVTMISRLIYETQLFLFILPLSFVECQ